MAVHRCRESESGLAQFSLVCEVCGRQFRRSGDLKHYKCNEPQSDAE